MATETVAVLPLSTARTAVWRDPALLVCRSMLNTCALHPRQYGKAYKAGADVACLDLEDSVPPASRDTARELALPFLAAPPEHRRAFLWALRVNSLHTADGLRDVLALLATGARPDVLVLPKVESPGDIRIYEELLCEALPEVGFLVVIETARGLAAVDEIAAASSKNRALIFGAADFSADLGSSMGWDAMLYARSRILVAAKAAGIEAIDAPCFQVEDHEALRRDVVRAAEMGYAGKVAVHPEQVPVINEGFTPDPQAVERAMVIMDAFESSRGKICVVDGKMIGPPAIIAARRTLARAGKPI